MTEEKQNNKRNILKGILAIIIYLLGSNILVITLSSFNIDLNKLSKNMLFIIEILYELSIVTIVFLLFKETIISNVKIYFKYMKGFLRRYIKYWLIALGAMYVCNLILFFITKGIANNEESIRELFSINPIIMILLGCIIAPILEEFIFRLSIFKIIGKHKYIFIIVSGLLFGCAHTLTQKKVATDFLYIIPYSIPGCIFAYTLYDSNNICVPISLHFIHNTFAFTLQLIMTLKK